MFESPSFCTTLRQAEHSAAEVALNSLSTRGPSHSLAARILDETGVYKNLLQEIAQRVGAALPAYTTFRTGLGHLPVFTCEVELAGITFTGEPAKSKKQAEKNAAMAAWLALKRLAQQEASSSSEIETTDEQEQITIARALLNYRLKEKMAKATANTPHALPFPKKFPMQDQKTSTTQPPTPSGSKMLPLIHQKTAPRSRATPSTTVTTTGVTNDRSISLSPFIFLENHGSRLQKFPAAGAAPYIPIRHYRAPFHGMAPPVTMRTAVPVYSSPPLPPPPGRPAQVMVPPVHFAPPVHIRPALPVFAAPAPLVRMDDPPVFLGPPLNKPLAQADGLPAFVSPPPPNQPSVKIEEVSSAMTGDLQEYTAIQNLKQLKI